MVILLSDRRNKCEAEIIEILKKYGARCISDKYVIDGKTGLTILSLYKNSDIQIDKGVVVFLDNGARFIKQKLPVGIVGICEENNQSALDILKRNKIEAVCCGMGSKNSITLSSIGSNQLFTCLQRGLQSSSGEIIEQGEFKIKLTKNYKPFSVMASTAILLLEGITPISF